MTCRLIEIDKCPGVRPIGIGETWRRLFSKCNVLHTIDSATIICGNKQLCAGLESGIEGAIHSTKQWWDIREDEFQDMSQQDTNTSDPWGFLLVDASNAFNRINRIQMLWTVRHEWP